MVSERLTLLTAVRLEFGLLGEDVKTFEKEWKGLSDHPSDWTEASRQLRAWFEDTIKARTAATTPAESAPAAPAAPTTPAAPNDGSDPAKGSTPTTTEDASRTAATEGTPTEKAMAGTTGEAEKAPAKAKEPPPRPVKPAHTRLAAVLLKNHTDVVRILKVEKDDLPALLTTISPKTRLIRAMASFLQLAPEVLAVKAKARAAAKAAAPVPTKTKTNADIVKDFLDLLESSFNEIRALSADSATPACIAELVRVLKSMPILFTAVRDSTNEYALLTSNGDEFTAVKGTPSPPQDAVILRAKESVLRPALDARKSVDTMVKEGILEVGIPARFQAEPALKAAIDTWYKDWSNRQTNQATRADNTAKLPVQGWIPVDNRPMMPLVTVIGAGVAGLTAASELAERGFRVQLVDGHRDQIPESPVSPGGIAKSQRRRLPDSEQPMTASRPVLLFNYPVPLETSAGTPPLDDPKCKNALSEFEVKQRRALVEEIHKRTHKNKPKAGKKPSPRAAFRNVLYHPGDLILPVWVEACRTINEMVFQVGAPPKPRKVEDTAPGAKASSQPQKAGALPETKDWYLGIQVRRRAEPHTGRLPLDRALGQATAVLQELETVLKDSQVDPWHQQIWQECGWVCEVYTGEIPAHIQAERLAFPQATYKLTGRDHLSAYTVYLQFEAYVIPGNEPWKGVVRVKDRVDFRVVQRTVMAEHGYRLFPSFYRHLFDTMSRIPLYDDVGRETGETLINNLVSPDIWQLADTKNQTGPIPFTRGRVQSLEDLRIFLKKLSRFGYTNRDLCLFELRLLKYLCSCEQRRDEAANKSWKDYMGLADFSPDFQRTVTDAPLSLLAMKAEEVDARTYLDVLVQLFLDQTADASRADRVLNGPTSEAFFLPWLDYLRRIDVRVFHGNLSSFRLDGFRLRPVWNGSPTGKPKEEAFVELNGGYQEPDYYILAIPLERAWQAMSNTSVEEIHKKDDPNEEGGDNAENPSPQEEEPVQANEGKTLKTEGVKTQGKGATPKEKARQKEKQDKKNKEKRQTFWRAGGVFATLWDWREKVEQEATLEKAEWPGSNWDGDVVPRDVRKRPIGPFRDMSGIQYYFRTGNRLGGGGHIYYLGAPWGLSTISQPQYWRVRRRPARDGYISNLSVDVCNLYTPGREASTAIGTGITTAPNTFAKEVWSQLLDAWPAFYRNHLLPPAWYHIDSNLHWKGNSDSTGGAYQNTTPYLINRPGEWTARPGQPVDQAPESREALLCQDAGLECIVWQELGWDQWLVAGPHMKTYTRLTTMEAANESARHAVNRLLLFHATRQPPEAPAPRPQPKKMEGGKLKNGPSGIKSHPRSAGNLAAETAALAAAGTEPYTLQGKLLGDFARTWTFYEQEPHDFAPLRRLDAQLQERKLPHLMDILKVEALLDASDQGDPMDRISKLWESVATSLKGDPLLTNQGDPTQWLKEGYQKIDQWIRESSARLPFAPKR